MGGRTRRVTLAVALAVAGIAATVAAVAANGSGEPGSGAGSTASDLGTPAGVLQIRPVGSLDARDAVERQPIAPGPTEKSPLGAIDLESVACGLPTTPFEPDDWVFLCDRLGVRFYLPPAVVVADDVASAEAVPDPGGSGSWAVRLTLEPQAAQRFEEFTAAAADMKTPRDRVAVVVGSTVVAAPAIGAPVTGGGFEIFGAFTQQQAQALVEALG